MAAYIKIHVRCHLTLKEMAAYIESHLRWHLTNLALLYKKVSICIHVRCHLTIL